MKPISLSQPTVRADFGWFGLKPNQIEIRDIMHQKESKIQKLKECLTKVIEKIAQIGNYFKERTCKYNQLQQDLDQCNKHINRSRELINGTSSGEPICQIAKRAHEQGWNTVYSDFYSASKSAEKGLPHLRERREELREKRDSLFPQVQKFENQLKTEQAKQEQITAELTREQANLASLNTQLADLEKN